MIVVAAVITVMAISVAMMAVVVTMPRIAIVVPPVMLAEMMPVVAVVGITEVPLVVQAWMMVVIPPPVRVDAVMRLHRHGQAEAQTGGQQRRGNKGTDCHGTAPVEFAH
jgi:hypothetical protein